MIMIVPDSILMPMKLKRTWRIIICCVVVIAVAAVFFFTRPSYALVLPEHPSWYSLGEPLFSLSFRKAFSSSHADVVFVMPGAGIPQSNGDIYLMRPADEGEDYPSVDIDENAMWAEALGDGRECIIYDSSSVYSSEIADYLLEADGNAFGVPYDGRVSDANIGRILSDAEGADKILLLTPQSSVMIARDNRTDIPVVMDFRDKAALTAARCDEYVSVNWNELISSALSSEPHLSYALIST